MAMSKAKKVGLIILGSIVAFGVGVGIGFVWSRVKDSGEKETPAITGGGD
jgi:predicted permease